ncbi:MAG: hypothetical protein JSV09_15675 [Thermoplasmata archaeon]|nr:MAG: hypothetical protein JSV09_15675 [Thermoplasmata archaeon]
MYQIPVKQASWKFIAVVVFLLLIMESLLWYIFIYEVERHSYSFSYSVYIEKAGEGNFTIIVPFPHFEENDSDWQNTIFDNLLASNNMDLDLVETEHGLGLRIQSNESCNLVIDLNANTPTDSLTMGNRTEDESRTSFWIYSCFYNGTVLTVQVQMDNQDIVSTKRPGRLSAWASGGGPFIEIGHYDPVEVQDGWHQYLGYDGHLIIN